MGYGNLHVINVYKNLKVSEIDFKLVPVSEIELLKIINNLAFFQSYTGLDGMPAKFNKKMVLFKFASPLSHRINLSLQPSVIPSSIKHARVVPLQKQGNRALKVTIVPYQF